MATFLITPKGTLINLLSGATPKLDIGHKQIQWTPDIVESGVSVDDITNYYNSVVAAIISLKSAPDTVTIDLTAFISTVKWNTDGGAIWYDMPVSAVANPNIYLQVSDPAGIDISTTASIQLINNSGSLLVGYTAVASSSTVAATTGAFPINDFGTSPPGFYTVQILDGLNNILLEVPNGCQITI